MTAIGVGGLRFEWRDWDARPLGAAHEWAHPGLCTAADGSVVVFDQTRRELVRLDGRGTERSRVAIPAACAHGLTSDSAERIWVADTGVRTSVRDGRVVTEEEPGSVFAVTAAGDVVMRLPRPEHAAYKSGAYIPTSVAVTSADSSGGDIWVADGYGQALVHRFAADGRQLGTLSGEEGGGRFDRAHCVFVDRRGAEPRILITDRSNHRVAVYDLDGRFVKLLGVGELRMPSAFAVSGALLIIAELWSRLAAYDPDDRLVGYLGDGEEAWQEPAWPNRADGDLVRRRAVQAGRFNAPHGMDSGPDGSIYVAEWSLGGRIVELAPANG